jgi:hypothetical protein
MLRAKQPRILQFWWSSPSCRIAFEFLVDRSSTHPTKRSSSMPTRLCAADVSKHTIAEASVRVVEQFTASWKYAPAGSSATMLFREAPCSHNTFFSSHLVKFPQGVPVPEFQRRLPLLLCLTLVYIHLGAAFAISTAHLEPSQGFSTNENAIFPVTMALTRHDVTYLHERI